MTNPQEDLKPLPTSQTLRLYRATHEKMFNINNKKGKKIKIDLPYDATIPLLGIYLEKTIIQKDACTQYSLQHYL